ncbi:hypothetical protein NH288_04700 [Anaerococcus sp. NML200537]|uniref:hypothetical protein n=1 Tax=Anaerococcus sp. NML200537 TaxID=2954485 RepID=UPI002238802C|nr:hypothetical protein [Anaerococcus sp. NML200537]MCW6701382.1 hypothetical protein [Anaerococcus sp. NML200537]
MRKLRKASKILNCSIFDERLKEFNAFDLNLLDWLIYFDDPENVEKHKNTFVDPEFEKYWNEDVPIVEENKVDVNNENEWEEVDLDE